MQTYIRVCPICVKENNCIGKNDVVGWIDWFKSEDVLSEDTKCPWGHDAVLIKKSMTCEEFNILNKVSTDPSFMESMNDLKEKDPIEFQLKMSQFKTSVGMQEQVEKQKDNRPKCPTCGSTNIEKISVTKKAVGGFMFGIFSSDVRNTMHCKSCGAKW